jgi:translation initiation factor 1
VGKKRIRTDGVPALTDSPFANLAESLGELPEGEPSPEPAEHSSAVSSQPFRGKIVVRREKKGRGGKTATVIEGLRGTPDELEALARALASQLGCGVRSEGNTVVCQGSQTDRIRAWLFARGAGTVIIGN